MMYKYIHQSACIGQRNLAHTFIVDAASPVRPCSSNACCFARCNVVPVCAHTNLIAKACVQHHNRHIHTYIYIYIYVCKSTYCRCTCQYISVYVYIYIYTSARVHPWNYDVGYLHAHANRCIICCSCLCIIDIRFPSSELAWPTRHLKI